MIFCKWVFGRDTSAWNHHRGFCLGNLSCRFWYPPAHRYTWADGWQGSSPSNLLKEQMVIIGIEMTNFVKATPQWEIHAEQTFTPNILLWLCGLLPGVFVSFGIKQRTKWGWVLLKLVMSLPKFSCRDIEAIYYEGHSDFQQQTGNEWWNLTLNCEDTVCMEPPFFLPPFLPPAGSVNSLCWEVWVI